MRNCLNVANNTGRTEIPTVSVPGADIDCEAKRKYLLIFFYDSVRDELNSWDYFAQAKNKILSKTCYQITRIYVKFYFHARSRCRYTTH